MTLVVDAQRARWLCLTFGHRQNFLPPPHDPIRLGKEPMTTEIHSIAAIVDGLGNAADLSVGLEDKGCDFGPPQEFKRSRQAGRSGARYDCNFLWFIAGGHDKWHSRRTVSDEKQLAARGKIPNEGEAGGPAFRNEVMHA
jgi:hypothetical protein